MFRLPLVELLKWIEHLSLVKHRVRTRKVVLDVNGLMRCPLNRELLQLLVDWKWALFPWFGASLNFTVVFALDCQSRPADLVTSQWRPDVKDR